MKSKSVLSLMELSIMVLVFALASTLCLRVFVYSNGVSRRGMLRDNAMAAAENAAETVKACRGELEKVSDALGGSILGDTLRIPYDSRWQRADAGEYTLTVSLLNDKTQYLGSALVEVEGGGETLFSLRVCWQEDV